MSERMNIGCADIAEIDNLWRNYERSPLKNAKQVRRKGSIFVQSTKSERENRNQFLAS